jgi:hypothetical protein
MLTGPLAAATFDCLGGRRAEIGGGRLRTCIERG